MPAEDWQPWTWPRRPPRNSGRTPIGPRGSAGIRECAGGHHWHARSRTRQFRISSIVGHRHSGSAPLTQISTVARERMLSGGPQHGPDEEQPSMPDG
jgi:hypothetical protein